MINNKFSIWSLVVFLLMVVAEAHAIPPIVVKAIPDQTWNKPGRQQFTIPSDIFAGGDGGGLSYSVTLETGKPLPGWLEFNSRERILSGNPSMDLRILRLKVTATDGYNNKASVAFRLVGGDNNDDAPRVIASHGMQDQNWQGSGSKRYKIPVNAFVDDDGDTLHYSATLKNGTALPYWLRFTPSSRTFSGNPPRGWSSLEVKVTVNDGHGGTTSDIVKLILGSNNDRPEAFLVDDPPLFVSGTQPLQQNLSALDADGDPLTYRIVRHPTKGSVVITNAKTGAFTYTAHADAEGFDSFTFRVNDGLVDSYAATIRLHIGYPPVAMCDTLNVNQDSTATGSLRSHTNSGSSPPTYSIVHNAKSGMAVIDNASTGAFTYTPNRGFVGADSFSFEVTKDNLTSETATISITVLSTSPAPVIKTGQTTRYGSSGDDGELERGVAWPTPRFLDNQDGTVTDQLTKLVWMKNASCWDAKNWEEAFAMIESMNRMDGVSCFPYVSGRHTDWRLPNREELGSLIDFGHSNPALPTDQKFTGLPAYQPLFWSSTTPASSEDYAWILDLSSGKTGTVAKSHSHHVWPVRGGE
ncbi:MAG: DUF1566 domain-containing protein [Magnetococcales bacterium]|nr:DUF1566 domain-containing protein [Magnetococcales bacterium]